MAPRSTSSPPTTTCSAPERELDRQEASAESRGDPRRRLQDPQVPRRAPAPAEAAPLVQVGGVLDRLSGFALLCIVYYSDARLRLIDPTVADQSRGRRSDLDRPARRRVARLRPRLPLVRLAAGGPHPRDPRPRHRHVLWSGAALPGPGRVPPGRRDARNDHGRQCAVRDHSGPPGARPGEEGGPHPGPEAGDPRQGASVPTTT